MKLASFEVSGVASWGVVEGETLFDTGAVLGRQYPDLKSAIAAADWATVRAAAARAPRHALADIAWLPVIPNPEKILCVGLNFDTHKKEMNRPDAEHPTIFTRFADTQLGHQAPILRPKVSTMLDYEGELAVIIGKPGRYIARQGALAHVAGYACYNDATLRDWQRHTHQFTPGKNFPATGAFGPWMVTADELPALENLRLTTRVNGETVQDATLGQMIFDVATLIEYCSAFTPLQAGDVIAAGTPGGVGFKRQPQLFMKPGDIVEVAIDGIGALRNPIADEAL